MSYAQVSDALLPFCLFIIIILLLYYNIIILYNNIILYNIIFWGLKSDIPLSLCLSFYATCISSVGIRNWHKLAQTPCPVLRAVPFFGGENLASKTGRCEKP